MDQVSSQCFRPIYSGALYYLAFHLAARVGPTGKVYANDILEQAVEVIRSRAAKKGLTNVEAVLGARDDPQFPTRGLDRVFCRSLRDPGWLARSKILRTYRLLLSYPDKRNL